MPYYHKEKGRLNICENFRGRCRNNISPLLFGNSICKQITTPNTDFSFGIKISSQQKRILPHAHFLLHYFFFHAAVTIFHDIYALGWYCQLLTIYGIAGDFLYFRRHCRFIDTRSFRNCHNTSTHIITILGCSQDTRKLDKSATLCCTFTNNWDLDNYLKQQLWLLTG